MPDPLTRFIPGPLNLQVKHWATLLKGSIALNRYVCLCPNCYSSVSLLGAYKPCPREARRFRGRERVS